MVLRRMFKSSLVVLLSVLGISASALDYSVTDPAWVFSGRLSEEADQFLTESNIEFNKKQKYLHEKYLSDQIRYNVDLEKKLLVVSKPKSRVEFEIKLLGSCRDSDSSWEWAWNNPNVERQSAFPRAELAPVARKYDLRYLNSGVITLPSEKFPWYLGGIALKVSPSAVGVYSASGEGMSYFFVLYRPREYLH